MTRRSFTGHKITLEYFSKTCRVLLINSFAKVKCFTLLQSSFEWEYDVRKLKKRKNGIAVCT